MTTATKKLSERIVVTDCDEQGIKLIVTDPKGHPIVVLHLDADEAVALMRWLA